MLQYATFCYLQNQKTGCTFVEAFLRECSGEQLVAYDKHAVAHERGPAKFYFVNVREPLALYRSLYAYGLDGKGTVFQRLTRMGHGRLYEKGRDGFSGWLRFVLSPENAPLLSPQYTPHVAGLVGLMTWRLYRLAVLGFEAAAPSFAARPEMNQFVSARFFMNAVLKQEELREGLARLVTGELASRMKDVPAALNWIAAAPKINTSVSITEGDEVPVDDDVRDAMFSCERQLYRNFYPDADGFARWRANKVD